MFRDLFNSIFKKKPDYISIQGYMPYRLLNSRKPDNRDILYSIVYVLIAIGLLINIERKLSPVLAKAVMFLPSYPVALAQQISYPTPTPETIVKEVIREDARVLRLETFLLSKNSPLSPHSEYIIKKSDEVGIDWTLMVAIAGKESGYGKKVAPGSYNPFGLGGTKLMHFDSWEEAIKFEAELLAEDYKKEMITRMQEKYCPSEECASNWTEQILAFSNEILEVK